MSDPRNQINEQAAATAFSKQASVFDKLNNDDTIIRYKRKRVREHVERFLKPGSHILELNAGTGEDAVYFAKQGHHIHATDISEGMLDIFRKKITNQHLESNISYELCSFTELETLQQQGSYDLIFSNFAGLNCTGRLDKVLGSFNWLLKPGGHVTLVILSKFCLWETLLLLKGKFKTAFRRFAGRKGARAHIEGEFFRCWYYNPSYIQKHLAEPFKKLGLEGLCTLVPPSYLENFAVNYPKLYRFLERRENKWKGRWPWKWIGDYYIITLRKEQ